MKTKSLQMEMKMNMEKKMIMKMIIKSKWGEEKSDVLL